MTNDQPAGPRLNRSKLADFAGVAPTTIDAWLRAGLPHTRRGKSLEFRSREVFAWIRERAAADAMKGTDIREDEIDRRTRLAKMQLAELETAKASGEVITIDESMEDKHELVARVRSKMLALPARYGAEIAQRAIVAAGVSDLAAVAIENARTTTEATLKDAVYEVLDELASTGDIEAENMEKEGEQ
ncbi:hypothetical protein F183_A29740 [Bryobacterales bacterium F-183]|nr:hypothetical protein F183_A29740 [Bryobacterales bacterium F-183]